MDVSLEKSQAGGRKIVFAKQNLKTVEDFCLKRIILNVCARNVHAESRVVK